MFFNVMENYLYFETSFLINWTKIDPWGIDPGMALTPFPYNIIVWDEIRIHNLLIVNRVRYPLDQTDAPSTLLCFR